MLFSTPSYFRNFEVPPNASLAGMSALAYAFDLQAPIRQPKAVSSSSISGGHRTIGEWTVYGASYQPDQSVAGHLNFAFKYETLDLLLLKRLFEAAGPDPFVEMIKAEPESKVSRKVWFLYEHLTGTQLAIPDTASKNYVEVLDPKDYFTSKGQISSRHRVRNNLLGTSSFCPIIRRTERLNDFVGSRWDTQAKEVVANAHKNTVRRATSYLLLADSQASYQIEGEKPARDRLERWMQVVDHAGERPLSVEELERLQEIIVEGDRWVKRGLRKEGGFIGGRNRENDPMPEFVSARHEDLPELVQGLLDAHARMKEEGVDAVLQAATLSFGFVFMHPFEDGNGRLHRYLMQHALAENGFVPKGVTLPISKVLLDRLDQYAERLRTFSGALLPFIDWVPTESKNVNVRNETADLYRYGDYTEITTFLYDCISQTIEFNLPLEIEYLKAFDEAKREIQNTLEMPDNLVTLLINFIRQNDGKLAKKRRSREFVDLTDEEVAAVETLVANAFEEIDNAPDNRPSL
jgi:Fic family protein